MRSFRLCEERSDEAIPSGTPSVLARSPTTKQSSKPKEWGRRGEENDKKTKTNIKYAMNKLGKTLSSKQMFIVGAASYVIAFLVGGIFGDALKLIGSISIIMAIIALNREIKERKKQKTEGPK